MATYDKEYFVNKPPFRICKKLIFDLISCRLPRNFKTGNGKAKLVFPSYVFYLKRENGLREYSVILTTVANTCKPELKPF